MNSQTRILVRRLGAALAWASAALCAQATVLQVDVTPDGRGTSSEIVDAAVRKFSRNVAILTANERTGLQRAGRWYGPVSLPISVQLSRYGQPVPPPAASTRGEPAINLIFNSASGRNFPTDYQALLQSIYTTVKPRLDATFGAPSVGGDVTVSNFDADIGDRDAVAGGYYTYDGSTQEIRFPVYSDNLGYKAEVAAVNFVHCLLLAYIGPNTLPADGWQEGLVRAAVMQIVRTPGALPATLDSTALESVLESTYTAGALYDWHNASALSGPTFIAPNLRTDPLPIGGSRGGLYLLRYQMAGGAFEKVLVQYPGFAKSFLAKYYAARNTSGTSSALNALGQAAIDELGGASSTIEGQTFASWALRQRILDFSLQPGVKLAVQAFPITSGLQGSEFGVFGIESHLFRTNTDGTETLLSGDAYPVYWAPDFTRFFTAGQDDKLSFYLGYAAVAPNFPGTAFAGEPYRVAVDVPAQDLVRRIYLPSGAVATASRPTPNNFYGCVTGVNLSPTSSLSVRVTWGGLNQAIVPVTHYAFGGSLDASTFELNQRGVKIELLRTDVDQTSVIYTRFINKGPGALAANLEVGADRTVSLAGISRGLNMIGWIGEPYAGRIPDVLGFDVLAARWNPTQSRYQFYPTFSSPTLGQGFFVRSEIAAGVNYEAYAPLGTPAAIALKPGWNLVVNPLEAQVALSDVQVITGTDFPRSFSDAVLAKKIGTDVFGFVPGVNDATTGVPETGSMIGITAIGAGRAFYVKCLASEGAMLLLSPSSSASRLSDGPPKWEIGLRVTSPKGEFANARIGGTPSATRALDASYDSELPPTRGGLQIVLDGNNRLFRDTRGYGRAETYTAKLEGIAKGAKFTLNVDFLTGKVASATVVMSGNRSARLTKSGTLTLTAASNNPTVVIAVPRVAR